MIILGIDTSAKSAGCAVLQDGCIISECFVNAKLTHSETMMPMVQNVLQVAKLTLQQIDYLAICGGPGSFTGLRIGASALKGMCQGANIKAVSVSTLLATAQNLAHLNGYIVPCMDARRNQVYTATFLCQDGVITRVSQDCAMDACQVTEHCEDKNLNIFLLGDGALLCYNVLQENPNVRLAPDCLRYTKGSGAALAAMSLLHEATDASLLQINYIRQSQAQRQLAQKQQGGL